MAPIGVPPRGKVWTTRSVSTAVLALGLLVTAVAAQAQHWPAVHGRGICNTPYGWCPLRDPEHIRAGSPCDRTTYDRRVVAGCTANVEYYGNVSPYFNPHTRQVDVPSMTLRCWSAPGPHTPPATVGRQCYCTALPRAAVYGTVTNRGHVNPFFNPVPRGTVPRALH